MITVAQQLAFTGWIVGGDEPTTSDDWYTPPELVALIEDFFGGTIHLDPCWSPRSHVRPLVAYTRVEDGLVQPWSGTVEVPAIGYHGTTKVRIENRFMNVPYSHPLPWMQRLAELHATLPPHAAGDSIAMVKADPSTRAWEHVWQADAALFCKRRVPFGSPKSVLRSAAPFPSALVYFGQHAEGFADFFAELGPAVVPIKRVIEHGGMP